MKFASATNSRCPEQIRCLDRHLFSAKAVHNSRRDAHVFLSCSVGIAVQVVHLQHANVEPGSVLPVVADATSEDFTNAGLSSRRADLIPALSKQSPNEDRAFFHSIGVLGASHEVVNRNSLPRFPLAPAVTAHLRLMLNKPESSAPFKLDWFRNPMLWLSKRI